MAHAARRTTEIADRRRARVAELKAAGKPLSEVVTVVTGELTNPRTGRPYSATTIGRDYGAPAVVQEMIGRDWYVSPMYQSARFVNTVDRYRADYQFWDKLRNCKAEGYEVSGLFCRAITDTLSAYVLGDRPTYTLAEAPVDTDDADDPVVYTNRALADFITYNHAALLTMLSDMYGLADQFVVINPDGSLSIPSPDTVSVEFDPYNYRRVIRAIVKTRVLGRRVEDEYTPDYRRVVWFHGGEKIREDVYENLLGRVPIVHFPNDRRANEQFGRTIYDALLPLFAYFNDLLLKGIDGVRLMGNPIPTFEGMENIQATVDANKVPSAETYVDQDGNTVTRNVIAFDTNGAIFVGKGGAFNFKHPAVGFTEDMRRMLRELFLLIATHVRMPELIWGAAVQTNNGAAETQMPPFERFVTYRRVLLDGQPTDERIGIGPSGGMYDLVDLWLRTRALTDPQIRVGDVRSRWPSVAMTDQQLRFQKTVYARGIGILPGRDTLDLLDLVSDPDATYNRAIREAPPIQDDYTTALNTIARRDADPENDTPDAPDTSIGAGVPPDPDGGQNVPGSGDARRAA